LDRYSFPSQSPDQFVLLLPFSDMYSLSVVQPGSPFCNRILIFLFALFPSSWTGWLAERSFFCNLFPQPAVPGFALRLYLNLFDLRVFFRSTLCPQNYCLLRPPGSLVRCWCPFYFFFPYQILFRDRAANSSGHTSRVPWILVAGDPLRRYCTFERPYERDRPAGAAVFLKQPPFLYPFCPSRLCYSLVCSSFMSWRSSLPRFHEGEPGSSPVDGFCVSFLLNSFFGIWAWCFFSPLSDRPFGPDGLGKPAPSSTSVSSLPPCDARIPISRLPNLWSVTCDVSSEIKIRAPLDPKADDSFGRFFFCSSDPSAYPIPNGNGSRNFEEYVVPSLSS